MPLISSLSKLRKYVPIKTILAAGATVGALTIGGTTLMSGYADTRERMTNQDISKISVQIEKERQDVKNDMYRNIIQREEWQRDPAVYDLQQLGSIGRTPGQPQGTQSYTGLIIIAVIALAAIYLLSGVLKK